MNIRMKLAAFGIAAATALGGAVAPFEAAQAQPSGQLIFGVDHPGDRPALDNVQFIWAGRNYCWYGGGWRGPGWYWCGYAWRRGFGWGGPYGWHGGYGHGYGHGGGHFDHHHR